jgi:hypothetical protein
MNEVINSRQILRYFKSFVYSPDGLFLQQKKFQHFLINRERWGICYKVVLAGRFNKMAGDFRLFKRRHDIQHKDIQHKDIQHNDTQHNDIQLC